MSTTSADPDDLTAYVAAASEATPRLSAAAGDLRGALDALRASEGRAEFLPDVPEVDLDLSFLARRWDGLADWLDGVARAFADADDGAGGRLSVEDRILERRAGRYRPPEVEAIERDGRLILDTGVGNDEVAIVDEGDRLEVTVNGTTYTFTPASDDEILVRLGQGNDLAAPADGGGATRAGLVLDGGSGGDRLAVRGGAAVLRGGSGDDRLIGGRSADRILGGDGRDEVLGQGGADRIIGGEGDDVLDGAGGDDWCSGGEGEDLIYGETGVDLLSGGAGRDHLDGGEGVDHVDGGGEDDVLSGGMGDDTVDGGAGADVAFGGPGRDLVRGGRGADQLHVEAQDVARGTSAAVVHRDEVDLTALTGIVLDVTGPLADRIRSDLVTLASTTAGAELLESLRGHVITIGGPGSIDSGNDAYAPGLQVVQYTPADDEAGFGPAGAGRAAGTLSYSPLLSLGHELIHASHDVNRTRVEGTYTGTDSNQRDTDRDGAIEPPGPDGDAPVGNEERATVGLPVDPDGDPSTPDVPASAVHPDIVDVTENDLRDELGLVLRGRY